MSGIILPPTFIYPVPEEEIPATDYLLTVAGQPVFTHQARVSSCPLNQAWPGYQRPKSQTEIASFASWDMSEPVEVVVTSSRPLQTVRVRPQSAGITPRVDGDVCRFTISKPGQYTVEVNGSQQALHLFANPPEAAAPNPRDANVLYFAPGVHCPGLINMKSGQTVYLAAGAVVYGAILAEKAKNISIRGRGILDGSKFDRLDGLTALLCLYDCSNVSIDGITLRDSPVFTVVPLTSRQVHIRNIKIIGNWRYNSDGINFISSQHGSVEDSFLRTFDDDICIKGYETFGPLVYRLQLVNGQWDGTFTVDGVENLPFAELVRSHGIYPTQTPSIHDIQVRNCVLWNDWGRALEIGAETTAPEIHDVCFEDCDIIHVAHVAMDVQNCDRARCANIVFRDIRVEMDDCSLRPLIQQNKEQLYTAPADGYLPTLLALEIIQGYCSFDAVRGHIQDISFENISVTAPQMPPSHLSGYDAEHLVQRVSIANLRLNGQPMTELAAAGIATNAFVREVTIRTDPTRILFLGNSITFHPAKAEIGWEVNWGMAASAPENDYVHLLLQHLAAANGGVIPESRVENIGYFEQEYQSYDFGAKLADFAAFKADIIVLAIGENVPALATVIEQAAFRSAVSSFLAKLMQNQTPALFVRGTFWADPVKNEVLQLICADTGGTFVDISALEENEANYARAERTFSHEGVAAHPGDAGMAAIADAILHAMHSRNIL